MLLLGVHCTHGFNRTGFLIISYLVQVSEWRYNFRLFFSIFCSVDV